MRRLLPILFLLLATPAMAQNSEANATAQVGQLQEEIRQLRGQLEQAQYAAQKAQQDLDKYKGDVDYRLRDLEQKAAAAAAAPPPAPAPAPVVEDEPTTGKTIIPAEPATYQKEEKTSVVKEAPPAATGKDFPNSNAHYSYAFKLLNDKDYAGAAASFDAFVKKYPNDPLTSNAYYWLGESYYARGDFTRASEGFRKGFEANPDGQKAPDNLLKLAMSLEKIKRTKEACIVLKQIKAKYSDSSPRTTAKAVEEIATLQCQ